MKKKKPVRPAHPGSKQKRLHKASRVVKPLLTKTEMKVALLIAKEYSHKMVATELGMKIRTVDTHVNNIHIKTKTHNAAGIANYIQSLGKE